MRMQTFSSFFLLGMRDFTYLCTTKRENKVLVPSKKREIMSLITCPECGHEVSTKAPQCPNCGVPIASNLKRCPVCDAIMLQDVERCPHCDTPFVVKNNAPSTPATTPSETVIPEPNTHASGSTTAPSEPTPETDKPTVVTPSSPTPRKSKGGWILLAVIVLLLAIAGLLFWQIRSSREASAEAAFSLLKDCNDPQSFEDFIMRYPKSQHIEEVQARLEELRQEEIAWQAAMRTTNPDIVRDFIDNYPTSTHQTTALHRIDTLEWRAADRLCTAASYTAYITAHAAGDFITEAYAARDEAIKREERARRDSIAQAHADSLAILAPFQ